MTEFPNKILLSQERETGQILDQWVINDYTDNITKEYVCLDKVCEWLSQHLYDECNLFRDNEGTWIDIDSMIADLRKELNNE